MIINPHIRRRVHADRDIPALALGAPAERFDDPLDIAGAINDERLSAMILSIGVTATFHQMDITAPGVAQEIVRAAYRMVEDERLHEAEAELVEPPEVGAGRAIAAGSLVYYIRLGPLCKIGTTVNLRQRMASLNPEELLVVEPGDRITEMGRHKQFHELRQHGEWFRYEGALVEHVELLRDAQDHAEVTA